MAKRSTLAIVSRSFRRYSGEHALMSEWMRKIAGLLALGVLLVAIRLPGHRGHHDFPAAPLPEKAGPLRKALLLLREGKTAEARKDLEEQRKLRPNDPDVLFQIARSYLLD